MKTETDSYMPTLPNNSSKPDLSMGKYSHSILENTPSKNCLTTPNKSNGNLKHLNQSKLKLFNTKRDYDKDNHSISKELQEFLNKCNLPDPDNLMLEMDKLVMKKLTVEYKVLFDKFTQAITIDCEKENKAQDAERLLKEAQEKADQLIKERNELTQRNIELKERMTNLTFAMGNRKREVERLNDITEKDKVKAKELNELFDSKLEDEIKAQSRVEEQYKRLTIEKENMLFMIEQAKATADDDDKNKNKKKSILITSLISAPNNKPKSQIKPKHLSNVKSSKELSDIVKKLTIELNELKKKIREYDVGNRNLSRLIKDNSKKIIKQEESINNLNLIMEEKEHNVQWSKLVVLNKKEHLNNLKASSLSKSLNIPNTPQLTSISSIKK